MKTFCSLIMRTSILPVIVLFFINSSFGQTGETPDKTGSPHFLLPKEAESAEQFPLKSTSAEINITGIIAAVSVKQTYKNEGKTAIEAIYVFPGSTRSAIHGLSMKIGERTIKAKISEREQARAEYQKAKDEGRTATLLEQHRPNVFQMNVSNILPGDVIEVELIYTELLEPAQGVYSFVYPAVVGPLYASKQNPAAEGEKWNENPYLKAGSPIPYLFNLSATLNSSIPIAGATCPSHATEIKFTGKQSAAIALKRTDEGNRDFIFNYKLQGNKIETGLFVFPGSTESYFLALVEPPANPVRSEATPREFVFILDVSGSMSGFPLDVAKKLIHGMIDGLTERDYFNILSFAGGSQVYSQTPVKATATEKQKGQAFVYRSVASGGTELLPALKTALTLPKEEGLSRSVVIATDGYITVEKECFELIQKYSSNANIHTFGIGSSVNRYLLEGMGKIGRGYHCVIANAGEAEKEAGKFRTYIELPLLTNIAVQFTDAPPIDLEPGTISDLLPGRPIVIAGKIEGAPRGKMTITALNGKSIFSKSFDYTNAVVSADYSALKQLWARKRIARLDEFKYLGKSEETKKQVTDLGLKYGLLTAYTSFLAEDTEVRNKGKQFVTVTQPLPLPENVSDMAVGYNATRSGLMTMSTKKMRVNEVTLEGSFSIPDVQPQFPGGEVAMRNFISKTMHYPEEAKALKIKGTVRIEFEVDLNGKLTNIRLRKGSHPLLDVEALRIAGLMPAWVPGSRAGTMRKMKVVMRVKFSL